MNVSLRRTLIYEKKGLILFLQNYHSFKSESLSHPYIRDNEKKMFHQTVTHSFKIYKERNISLSDGDDYVV